MTLRLSIDEHPYGGGWANSVLTAQVQAGVSSAPQLLWRTTRFSDAVNLLLQEFGPVASNRCWTSDIAGHHPDAKSVCSYSHRTPGLIGGGLSE